MLNAAKKKKKMMPWSASDVRSDVQSAAVRENVNFSPFGETHVTMETETFKNWSVSVALLLF
jgi:hypothetical protein